MPDPSQCRRLVMLPVVAREQNSLEYGQWLAPIVVWRRRRCRMLFACETAVSFLLNDVTEIVRYSLLLQSLVKEPVSLSAALYTVYAGLACRTSVASTTSRLFGRLRHGGIPFTV